MCIILTVRTYVRVKGKQQEITGPVCSIESNELKVAFKTPAIVYMPVFKGKPTSAFVKCTAGERTLSKVASPSLNGTAIGGASAAGLVMAIVSTAIVAAADLWSNPIPQLVFEEG